MTAQGPPIDFCVGLDASVPVAKWYAFQLFFVSLIIVVDVALSTLREWNWLEAKVVRWFRRAAICAAVLIVLAALSANMASANRIAHETGSIPWCGAERYSNCTVYTASVFGAYSRFYGGASVAIGFCLWLAFCVAQVMHATSLFYWISGVLPNRSPLARTTATSTSKVVVVERLAAQWLSVAVDEYRLEGLLLWWGPGLAVAASVPYGSPPCLLNRSTVTLRVEAVLHGSLMLVCLVGALADVTVAWLTNRRRRRFCVLFVSAFTFGSLLLTVAEILSTSAQPYMWMLWSFSLAYPAICRLCLDAVEFLVDVLAYRTFSGAEFIRPRCQWNLNHRISAYDNALQRAGRRPSSLAEALTAIDGALDGWFLTLDLPAIEKQARRDLYATGGHSLRTRRSSGVEKQGAFALGLRGDADPESLVEDAAPSSLESEELHLVMLMFTCILPIREDNFVDAIFGRLQLFDQLQHALMKYVHRSADEFEQSVEWKLLPLLSLISRALRCLPTTPQGRGWLENEAGVSTFVLQRYATSLDVQRWLVEHAGPLGRAARRGDEPNRNIAPLSFRTFRWGYTDAAVPNATATFNDAIVTVASAPEVHFEFSMHPVGRDDDGDDVVQLPSAALGEQERRRGGDEVEDADEADNDAQIPAQPAGHGDATTIASMGQCRYVRDVASPSWFEAGRGDVLYCPHARFAIVSVDVISSPGRIAITDMVAPSPAAKAHSPSVGTVQRNLADADNALQFDF